ncbi:MAG: BNR-4 repeat-containing protein [Eubacterium sp.]|nr:BNR-4 repeat-containing protein [Eubacterium sp.]
MKKIRRVLVMVLLILASVLASTENMGRSDVSMVRAAGKVAISKTSVTVYVGNKVSLKLKNAPQKVKWVVKNKKIATVSSNGVVTAKKAGKTSVIAKCNGKNYKCIVTVKQFKKITPKLENKSAGVKISWSKLKGAKGYYIYRRRSGKKKFKKIVSTTDTSYVDKAVETKKGISFDYAVCAYNGKCIGDKLPKKIIRLKAPAIKNIYVDNYNELVIEFNEAKGAKKYQLQYTNRETTVTTSFGTDKKSYTIKNIQPQDTYSITMRSVSDGMYSDWCAKKNYEITEGVQNFSINESNYGPEDVCWTWWSYPQMVSYKGIRDKSYFGYTTSLGYIGVGSYDMNTGAVIKTNLALTDADDHNSCSVNVLKDGRIMAVFASGHDKDKFIHVRISAQSESISRFNKEIKLEASGKTSYSQVYNVNGTYYVFYRCNSKNWNFFKSTDLKKWSNENKFISGPVQYYIKITETTNPGLYRVTMTGNPASADHNIRMGFINFSNGAVYNSDMTILGQLGTSIDATRFNVVIPQEEGKYTRLFDVAVTNPDSVEIAYCKWNVNGTKADYSILRNKEIYEIATQSDRFWLKYFGGIAFIDKDNIVVSYGNDCIDHVETMKFGERTIKEEVEDDEIKHTDTEPIEKKYVEKTIKDFHLDRDISKTSYKDSHYRSVRPVVDINDKTIMWQYGYYDSKAYTSFNMDARFIKIP